MAIKKLTADFYRRNRKKLVHHLPDNCVAIIECNDQMPRTGDQYFPYRQQADLYYLTGITQEKTSLVIVKKPGKEALEYLFLLKPNEHLEKWEGKKLDKPCARSISGIDNIQWNENKSSFYKAHLPACEKVYFNDAQHPRLSADIETRDKRIIKELKAEFPLVQFANLNPILCMLRIVKEPEEIEQTRQAINITQQAFNQVRKCIKPGVNERDIAIELLYQLQKHGADGHAFHPIIASGKNACYLHYDANDRTMKAGELVLMDFGAEINYYTADCSRTLPVDGTFTKRQEKLFSATLRTFNYAKSIIKPGININEINKKVALYWQEEHISLGLYTKTQTDADALIYKKYFPHGTSHYLGIDVHDVGSPDTPLQEGMIITCEPGIYIDSEGIGIRLENDLLITENGNEDLMDGFDFL